MEATTAVTETNGFQPQAPVQNRDGLSRTRTYNPRSNSRPASPDRTREKHLRRRRCSHDAKSQTSRRFLIDVEETERLILAQEDTDGDFQITVQDIGPKVFKLGTANSEGYLTVDIRGTYMLSNLLQELTLAKDVGRKSLVIDEARLNENPVDRLSRMIRTQFWDGLTRRIDADGLELICNDPKNRTADHNPRIYVPYDDPEAYEFYKDISAVRPHLKLDVVRLPKDITPQYVNSIDHTPGILSLATYKTVDASGNAKLVPVPFVVPGGRFNEMYGWDSYFEALGLIIDKRVDLARGMVENFVYEINHYGKILNANRSYFLTRSQPPFLTDMAIRVFEALPANGMEEKLPWLAKAFHAAIKEYNTVWMAPPRLDPKTGLSRYRTNGIGMPPETESSHFDHIVQPFAEKRGMSVEEFKELYAMRQIDEPDLDEFFVHDRAVRESGHDTSYRLEKVCADLATVDLNALLFKYEVDIGEVIRDYFDDQLEMPDGTVETSDPWFERSAKRKQAIDKYLWNEEKGLYFDYNTRTEQQTMYESVTSLYALWAECASQEQADKLIQTAMAKFESFGGLVCGTEESRGEISLDRPNRQWDYPFGWAPHQILAWRGIARYGYIDVARRIAYRWLYIITKSFVDFNGVVPEKYDVVNLTHQVEVEYGNVGTDFKCLPREGFGWMNASYQIGLSFITMHMRRALGTLTSPEVFFERTQSRYGSASSTPYTGSRINSRTTSGYITPQ